MKISTKYPQFENKAALILICGKQLAEIVRAEDGVWTKINTVKEKTPEYSDHEGFFMRSGQGKVYGSGSVYETNKQAMISSFVSELNKEVQKEMKSKKYTSLYIFAPSYMAEIISKSIVKSPKIEKTIFTGNFTKKTPEVILKKLANLKKKELKSRSQKKVPVEAKKILKKASKAKKVIRTKR